MTTTPTPTNRVSLDALTAMPVGEIAGLPIDQLALLLDDLAEEKARLKRLDDWLNGALALRYSERAQTLRRDQGKLAGIVRIEEADGFVAVCDVPKKPEYDQEKLRAAIETLRSWGSDPDDYVTTEIKVSETKYGAWPPEIRRLFEPARTVRLGKPNFRIERPTPR